MTENKNNRDFELEDFFNAAKQTAPEVSETLRRKILDTSEQEFQGQKIMFLNGIKTLCGIIFSRNLEDFIQLWDMELLQPLAFLLGFQAQIGQT